MADEEQQQYQQEAEENNGGGEEQQPIEGDTGDGGDYGADDMKHEPGSDGGAAREDVCRDFLKNICNRGSRCKFYHPPESKARTDEHINFCIDFQNRGCMRDNCRFVHATRDLVEQYKVTHEVTLPLARAIAAVTHGDTIAGIPLCKEFQSGKCLRGAARCRYWHVNVEEERERRARGLPPGGPMGGGGGGGGRYPGGGGGGPPGRGYGGPTPGYGGGGGGMGGPGMRRPGGPMDDPYGKRPRMMDDQRLMELERRNGELMKEVDTLKRELQRERERYEDLYALFRNQSGGGGVGVGGVAPVAMPKAQQQQQQQQAAQQAAQGYAATYATSGWNQGAGW